MDDRDSRPSDGVIAAARAAVRDGVFPWESRYELVNGKRIHAFASPEEELESVFAEYSDAPEEVQASARQWATEALERGEGWTKAIQLAGFRFRIEEIKAKMKAKNEPQIVETPQPSPADSIPKTTRSSHKYERWLTDAEKKAIDVFHIRRKGKPDGTKLSETVEWGLWNQASPVHRYSHIQDYQRYYGRTQLFGRQGTYALLRAALDDRESPLSRALVDDKRRVELVKWLDTQISRAAKAQTAADAKVQPAPRAVRGRPRGPVPVRF